LATQRRKPSSSVTLTPPVTAESPQGKPVVKLILDSGAWSAWRQKKPIDFNKYCDHIKRNEEWIYFYVNLDHIEPGNPQRSAEMSFANLKAMRTQGLDPMPVFHAHEDISWLYRMLDLGCTRIGLAGLSLGSHAHLVDTKGNPIIKVHALGEGRFDCLTRYPWATADSTSWIYASNRNGEMRLPSGHIVAARNDKSSSQTAPDIEQLSHEEERLLRESFAEMGISNSNSLWDRGSVESYVFRLYITACFYKKQAERVNEQYPIHYQPSGFFQILASSPNPGSEVPQQEFFLATGYAIQNWVCSAYAECHQILISYFDVANEERLGMIKSFVYNPIYCVQHLRPDTQKYIAVLEKYLEKH
jgi:hypothetical protein